MEFDYLITYLVIVWIYSLEIDKHALAAPVKNAVDKFQLVPEFLKDEEELTRHGECPLDPGGYYVIKGTEKVEMTGISCFIVGGNDGIPANFLKELFNAMWKVKDFLHHRFPREYQGHQTSDMATGPTGPVRRSGELLQAVLGQMKDGGGELDILHKHIDTQPTGKSRANQYLKQVLEN
ncbi:hypothetical protein PHJA_002385600 [Phtheirospermum japonicum]|uniref:DNA-directed RNA polymerase n=1 Tax=Phtheirospermum japonicum TaxID=374723 RepID=A0A830CTC8_9LAMI|nr:hypothetical protein PHJA_002385600 [Phtheirospermum japonicum]